MEGLRKKCLAGFTEALQIGGESTTFQGGEVQGRCGVAAFDAVFFWMIKKLGVLDMIYINCIS